MQMVAEVWRAQERRKLTKQSAMFAFREFSFVIIKKINCCGLKKRRRFSKQSGFISYAGPRLNWLVHKNIVQIT